MEIKYANRLKVGFQAEFIRKILGAAATPDMISFAGGLPNPTSFPIQEIKAASVKVLDKDGVYALQYNAPKGYRPLRQWIADRYVQNGVEAAADDILITNGSQQGLDIISNVLLNEKESIIVEEPCYLGALNDFNLFNPEYLPVTLTDSGLNLEELKAAVQKNPKFIYSVPNFQNPTGLTYSDEHRDEIAAILIGTNILFIEDNPYGELRFSGTHKKSMKTRLGDQCIVLGTFSKIVSPGMRLGWMLCTHKELMANLTEMKQALDTHTSIYSQMVMNQYLADNDLDAHIEKICTLYKHQSEIMLGSMEKYFPSAVEFTKPDGGMFIWAVLPDSIDVLDLFKDAAKAGVSFVAGNPFYTTDTVTRHTLRMNYTNSDDASIEKGVRILGDLIQKKLAINI